MIKRIEIRNFKRIGNDGLILNDLAPINYLVGENGSGKSSVLEFITFLKLNSEFINQSSKKLEILDKFKIIYSPLEEARFHHNTLKGVSFNLVNSKNEIMDGVLEYGKELKLSKPFAFPGILKILCDQSDSGCFKTPFLLMKYLEFSNYLPTDINDYIEWNKYLYKQYLNLKSSVNFKIWLSNSVDLSETMISQMDSLLPNFDHEDQINFSYNDQTNEFLKAVLDGYDLQNSLMSYELAEGRKQLNRLFNFLESVLHDNSTTSEWLFLIENPENHLHPFLEKKIPEILELFNIKYKEKEIQFIITTHSPFVVRSALNFDNQKIYHLEKGELGAEFDKYKISTLGVADFDIVLKKLGFEMKDIYYPNCLIYVEGAYDILYLEYLLRLYEDSLNPDNKLIKGLDFAFVEYGGALASHLTIDEIVGTEVQTLDNTKLINIFNLNRKIFFITDGDANESNFESAKNRLKELSELSQYQNSFVFYKESDPNIKTIEDYFKELAKIDGSDFVNYRTKNMEYTIKKIQNWKQINYSIENFNHPALHSLVKKLYDTIIQWNI